MENKNNFAGIIIPVVISVILLTALPIINSINVECPPCEQISSLTGTKWTLPENIETAPGYIDLSFNIDISPYEIELNTLLKLRFTSGEFDSITTWEELLDFASYFITDIGGTNVVNNMIVENDNNNYLIVPTKGYLQIYSSESYGYLYYGLDLSLADNLPIVSGILTFEHPIDGTLSFNFIELFVYFFNPSISLWDEIPIKASGIINDTFSTITITGGDDVTNPTLIAWLQANATQIID